MPALPRPDTPPFDAAEVREGMPVGRKITWSMQMGDKTTTSTWEVTGASDTEMTWATQPGGRVQSETWEGLVSHARFPAEATTVTADTLETAFGTFDAIRYTVTEGEKVRTYWFVRAFPGAPVRHTVEVAGKQTFAMEQTAREP